MPSQNAPSDPGRLVTIQVVDWKGPIVEVVFHRPIRSLEDVRELVDEADEFMRRHVLPTGARKAYFLTCYDHFAVAKDLAHPLQEAFLRFNEQYSLGDARYGGTLVAQSLVISTAIRSESPSELHATREDALGRLRKRIRGEG